MKQIKDLPANERPREKLLSKGASAGRGKGEIKLIEEEIKMKKSQEIKVNQRNTTNIFGSKNTPVPLMYRASDKKYLCPRH